MTVKIQILKGLQWLQNKDKKSW